MNLIDRTKEKDPLVVKPGEVLDVGYLIDNNPDRMAVINYGGTVKGSINRKLTGVHAKSSDPPLNKWFGTILPPLDPSISFSPHDACRSAIFCVGSCTVKCTSITSDVGVMFVCNPDGSYGEDSYCSVTYLKGRFGVLYASQRRLSIKITNWTGMLYSDGPAGHMVYGNVLRKSGVQQGGRSVEIQIGKARTRNMAPKIRFDHVTMKAKSTHGLRYKCLDSIVGCGDLDLADCSGFCEIVSSHDGSDAQNNVFTSFRVTTTPENPPADGKLCLTGCVDCSKAPDQSIHSYRWETSLASFARMEIKGGGAPDVYHFADNVGSVCIPNDVPN